LKSNKSSRQEGERGVELDQKWKHTTTKEGEERRDFWRKGIKV
jgi:hypothetical protein